MVIKKIKIVCSAVDQTWALGKCALKITVVLGPMDLMRMRNANLLIAGTETKYSQL